MLDGPLDSIATRSPSCSRFLARSSMMRLDVRRVLGLEVHVVDEDEDDAAGDVLHRPAGLGQHDALGRRRRLGRRPAAVKVRPPCTSANDGDRLRHAVLEHREVVLGQVGDEPAVAIAGDDVGGHRGHRRAECRLPGRRRRLLRATPSVASASQAGEPRARARTRIGHLPIIRARYGILGRVPRRPTPHPPPSRRRFLSQPRRSAAWRCAARTRGWPGCGRRPAVRRRPAGELVRVLPALRRRRPGHAARRDGRRPRARRPAVHRSLGR